MTVFEMVVVALWGAATVFVLWHGVAHWALRRWESRKQAQATESVSEAETAEEDEVARARLEMELRATTEAWEVLNRTT